MNGQWHIELFGGLNARSGDRVLTHFETRKVAALLAWLSLHPRGVHSREMLAELLWPDEDGIVTRNRLRHALSCLRRELEPDGPPGSVLIASRNDVGLGSDAVVTDVARFEAALKSAAAASELPEQAGFLRKAVELYRGELLPGFYEEWVLAERERLAAAYQGALGRLADSLAFSGDLGGAIETARRSVAADCLREDAHCTLMRLYAAAGRFPEALRQYRELERILHAELGVRPSAATRALLETLRSTEQTPLPPIPRPEPSSPASRIAPEGEGGAVPLGSPYYLSRPVDAAFHQALSRRDSIVLVKGPRQVGKTSLLARGLQQSREAGARVVLTDFQKLDAQQVESVGCLFRSLAEMIADQLDLNVSLEETWQPLRGWNVNFERFLRREVLGSEDGSLVWGLDEVDRLFTCSFSSTVFGLFRSWHNERALNPGGVWSRLTLAIAYATEAHLFITDLNQSPFNVGSRLTLDDFTRGEVEELNQRYGAPLKCTEALERFLSLVGGHPYLVRRGLGVLAVDPDLERLLAAAPAETGVFGDHLRRLLLALGRDADLRNAAQAVMIGKPCPTDSTFYRLRSAGVIAGDHPAEARPRCGLYQLYLRERLA